MPRYMLDSFDTAIVEQLREDGRASLSSIAAAVGLSDDAVRVRIGKLTKDSIIKVIGVVDPRMLGYESQAAVVATFRGDLAAAAAALREHPEVTFLVVMVGQWNILCEVTVRDDNALTDFVSKVLLTMDGMQDVEVWKHLSVRKWQTGVRPLHQTSADTEAQQPKLDELDLQLLHLLSENPRASYTDLHAAVGGAYKAVRRRIQVLFDSGVIRAETVVNRVSTQTLSMATLGLHVESDMTRVLDALAKVSEIEILIRTSGRFPIIAEVACADSDELVAVTDMVHAVRGVTAVEIFPHARIEKLPAEWVF